MGKKSGGAWRKLHKKNREPRWLPVFYAVLFAVKDRLFFDHSAVDFLPAMMGFAAVLGFQRAFLHAQEDQQIVAVGPVDHVGM